MLKEIRICDSYDQSMADLCTTIGNHDASRMSPEHHRIHEIPNYYKMFRMQRRIRDSLHQQHGVLHSPRKFPLDGRHYPLGKIGALSMHSMSLDLP